MGETLDSINEVPAVLGGRPVFPDGPPAWPRQRPDVLEILQRAYADGSWGRYHGEYLERLSSRLAQDWQVQHVALCCSGTVAIELALRGLKVGPGDEVLLAGYDFSGNFADVLAVGATPVLVDIDPQTLSLDPGRIHDACTDRTKAIVVSHLHGGVAAMPEIMAIADSRGMGVIEDACQMPGSWVHGRRAGRWGHIGVVSFGGSKLLTAGRGGALFTDDPLIAQRIHLFCFRGNDAYPLSELQAAVLLPQLGTLDTENAIRAKAVGVLTHELADLPGIRLLTISNPANETKPGFYKIALWYDAEQFDGLTRDQFAHALRAEGVAIYPGFRGLHLTHSRRRFRQMGPLPHSSAADSQLLVLHHPILLQDDEQLRRLGIAFHKVAAAATRIRHT